MPWLALIKWYSAIMRSTWLFRRCNSSAPFPGGLPATHRGPSSQRPACVLRPLHTASERLESAFVFLEGERNRRVGIPPPRLGTTTFPGGAPCSAGLSRCCSATLGRGVSGTPVSRAAPWTPAAAASLFRGWDSAWGHPPHPRGGFGMVACVEAAAVTGGAAAITGRYGGGVKGP